MVGIGMTKKNKGGTNIMKDVGGYLTPQQIKQMRIYAANERDRMLILVGWRTGRRISEILKLKKRDIDFMKELIKFNILKKRNPTIKWKAIDSKTIQSLKSYTENMQPDDYVFPSPYVEGKHLSRAQAYNIIRNTAEAAGIFNAGDKPVHPHVLRHSYAVNYLKRAPNVSDAIRKIQMQLEHSNIAMTSTYLQFDQSDIKEDLNKIFQDDD